MRSTLVKSTGYSRITAQLKTLASIILVFATSRGVVTAAENPPATAPHKEACQGLGASYKFNFEREVTWFQHLACDCGQLLLQELPEGELNEGERDLPGKGGEVASVQPQYSLLNG